MTDSDYAYFPDVIVTRKPDPVLPPPFVCVDCLRIIEADRWLYKRHQPPICNSCTVRGGHQARIPGMTRGDHHTLQRLVAVTNALDRVAHWKAVGWH